MKIQFKNIIIGALVLGLLTSPFYSFAAETKVKTLKEKVGFCSRLDVVATKITSELNQRTEKFTNKKDERLTNLTKKWDIRDVAINDHKESQDTRIDARFASLMAKADTEVKKEAVNKFEESVGNAVEIRRASINTAIDNFRDGVILLVNNKFLGIDSRVLTLKNSVEEALSVAKTSCGNDVSDEAVRTTLKNSIKSAYDIFRQDKTELVIKSDIDKLSLARKEAVDEAVAKFKTDMESAKVELKLAFSK